MKKRFTKNLYEVDAEDTYVLIKSELQSWNNPEKKRLLEGLEINYEALLEKKGWKKGVQKLDNAQWVQRRYDLVLKASDENYFDYWLSLFLISQKPQQIRLILDKHYRGNFYNIDSDTFLNKIEYTILRIISGYELVFSIEKHIEIIESWIREKREGKATYVPPRTVESNDDRIVLQLTYQETLDYFSHLSIYDRKKEVFNDNCIRNLILSNFRTTDYKDFPTIPNKKLIETPKKYTISFLKKFVYDFSIIDTDNKKELYAYFLIDNFKVYYEKSLIKDKDIITKICSKFSLDAPVKYPFELRNNKLSLVRRR
jgi:hypothetical protein